VSTTMRCAFLLSAAFGLAGCGTDESYVFVEGFEVACDGAPCFWTVQSGTPGAARWNETLPGEHGVLMEGDPMAIVRDMSGVELDDPVNATVFAVELAARCDGVIDLTVEMSVESLASGDLETFTATFNPGSTWDGTLDSRTLTSSSGAFGIFFRDIVALRLVKLGAGTCEVDYLSVRTESGF
jgi:hypothetical protein